MKMPSTRMEWTTTTQSGIFHLHRSYCWRPRNEWYALWLSLTEKTISFPELEEAAAYFGDQNSFSLSSGDDSSGGNINNSGELEMLSQTAWAAHKHLVDSAEKAAAAAATGKASSTYSSLSSLPIYPWPVGSVDSTWCALQRRSFRRFALLRRLYRDMATVQRTLRAIERLVVSSPSPLAQSNDNKYNNDDDGDKDDDGDVVSFP